MPVVPPSGRRRQMRYALCFHTTPAREVSVGKRKVTENKTVTGTVRKEEAVVESTGNAKVRQTSKPGKK